MNHQSNPRTAYESRLQEYLGIERGLARQQGVIANLRLFVFAVAMGLAWVAYRGVPEMIPWLAVPLAIFVVLVLVHLRVSRKLARVRRGVAFFDRGLANLDGRWAGRGPDGLGYLKPDHPFAEDLDLFGTGSLFERICFAQTTFGQNRLAEWFLEPGKISEIKQRQQAVAELKSRLDFREDLFVSADDFEHEPQLDDLIAFSRSEGIRFTRAERWLAPTLALISTLALSRWLFWDGDGRPFFVGLGLECLLFLWVRSRADRVISGIQRQGGCFSMLSEMVKRLESESFEAERLSALKSRLKSEVGSASDRLASLARLLDLLDASRNQMFMPISWLLLWRTQLAFRINDWREANGPEIPGWIDAIAEFEALCSLASFAFENPDSPFPEIAECGEVLEAIGLGHPLIPAKQCVRNDLFLGESIRLLIVSGSNMSGKSTFLRSIGINVVLALAGTTVFAERLKTSRFAIGATMRVRDSLQEGRSRFYSEILRLKQLVELAREHAPLLFLIDEVLHGTNSHDRRVAAESILRGLLNLGAVGLVTTHDLALTSIAEALDGEALNVHFEDRFEDGLMKFDYKLHQGVVLRSNALELMRSVGLEVADRKDHPPQSHDQENSSR